MGAEMEWKQLLNALAVVVASAAPALAQDAVAHTFAAGLGPDAVGLIDASEDTEIDGPQAIYSGERGEIYLLDQLNGRLLQFDPNAADKPPKTLQLPADLRPTDLVVARDAFYVWDGEVRTLQASGADDSPSRELTLTRALGDPDEFTVSAFAAMGSRQTDSADDSDIGSTRSLDHPAQRSRPRQFIASRGRGPVVADLSPTANESGIEIDLHQKNDPATFAKLHFQVRSRIGTVEVLEIDKQGRIFVLAENVPTDSTDQAAAFVARFGPAGALEGVYELPLSSAVALSRRFVTVSPEGDVYFLRTRTGSVDVLGVSFRSMKNAAIIDTAGPKPALSDFAKFKGANAAVRPLNRQQVIATAFAFANVRWRVNSTAYGRDPDTTCSGFNRVRRPGYLSGKLNQEVQGIPYCWGCHGSLSQIATAIQRGVLAGNVCTRDDPRRDVAGVDCSAFVSAAWGLATHFTTIAIPAIAKQLANPWDLLPGDALNKPGSHVMLFLRFTPDKKVEVMESSTGGCNGKVCRNIYPLASLLARGYDPVRYRGLASDTSAPAAPLDPAKISAGAHPPAPSH
jgi:hypothetical protein